ncbi:unnamed protein product [Leptidea sinapis]|uniref:Uncharacterized protein n=1 Tax=Leptidea sinapis TaxID=189913 RepID=A0A5E4R4Q6_9NEOP|nr:unnamed protein product [Leptidea sinapis]
MSFQYVRIYYGPCDSISYEFLWISSQIVATNCCSGCKPATAVLLNIQSNSRLPLQGGLLALSNFSLSVFVRQKNSKYLDSGYSAATSRTCASTCHPRWTRCVDALWLPCWTPQASCSGRGTTSGSWRSSTTRCSDGPRTRSKTIGLLIMTMILI